MERELGGRNLFGGYKPMREILRGSMAQVSRHREEGSTVAQLDKYSSSEKNADAPNRYISRGVTKLPNILNLF